MQTPNTLTELLALSNLTLRAYSVGRRISQYTQQQWSEIENSIAAVELPLLGHEWLAISLVGDQGDNQGIWWLRLPLDELNKIAPGQMTALLDELAATINHNLKNEQAEHRAPMDHCQFAFTPSDDTKAVVVALEKLAQNSSLSQEAEAVIKWIQNGAPDNQWQAFSIQALTDALFANTLSIDELQSFLSSGPAPVVDQAFKLLMHAPLASADFAQLAGIAHPMAPLLNRQLIELNWSNKAILQTQTVALFQFSPTLIETQSQMAEYLEGLAQTVNPNTFAILTQDLLRITKTRDMMWAVIRNTERSETLSKAIEGLFKE